MNAFFDSNILVYAYSSDQRRLRAAMLIAEGGTINVQVLNEFTNVLLKKQKADWTLVERAIDSVTKLLPDIRDLTPLVHRNALPLARDHKINIYDALIIAAAQEADCDVLYSEDLQDGRKFGDLLVVNPFGNSLRGY